MVKQGATFKIHTATGRDFVFSQPDEAKALQICADLDGPIFTRGSIVVDGPDDATVFPGHAIVGFSVATSHLPAALRAKEDHSGSRIMQIEEEHYGRGILLDLRKMEGISGHVFSELIFSNGQRLFIESEEVTESPHGERNSLNHLFARPALWCRTSDGFSVWSTAHIVSWSHYPKLAVPANAWPAEFRSSDIPALEQQIELI